MSLVIPPRYKPMLAPEQTEMAIKLLKDTFEHGLSFALKLRRVTAPLFVFSGTGVNDDLNGVERAVRFPVKCMDDRQVEVVHSLAKWKRMKLASYSIPPGYGLYTDMNAIRPDEELSNIHSLYVDQWDWERTIQTSDRNLDFLKKIVREIYGVLLKTEAYIFGQYPQLEPFLPEQITFLHSEELLEMYPGVSPKERERRAVKKFGAVFVIGIVADLADGKPHDGRAPDYDDLSTPTMNGFKGLNGDILVWNPVLDAPLELSSMGIRVDRDALVKQLDLAGCPERKTLLFHKMLLSNQLPLSVGGGIGQSRLCMFFLRKAHIGEVQASIWPEQMEAECRRNEIFLM